MGSGIPVSRLGRRKVPEGLVARVEADAARGGVPERSKGTDCKSVGEAFGGSNPPLSTRVTDKKSFNLSFTCWGEEGSEVCAGVAQLARATAFQAVGRGFESRFPLQAHVAQLVERILGKDEVHRFNPGRGLQSKSNSTFART